MTSRTLSLFAGPGGMDEAARILGVQLDTVGVEIDPQTCATAEAAGHSRINADVRTLNPADFPGVTGLVVTPPCPTFSASGNGTGRADLHLALDAVRALGEGDSEPYRTLPERVQDERTALVVEAARWALELPDVEWLICEQVPAVEPIWEELAATLTRGRVQDGGEPGVDGPGWAWSEVVKLDAVEYGAGARRTRTFLIARRYWDGAGPRTGRVSVRPNAPIPAPTAAEVLGWPVGEKMRTRNNRRPTGGNLFSTDGPSWCLTGKARSWMRDSDGARLDVGPCGALQGFPRDYPWQGSRSSQFQQAGDVVSPLVGAAVLGVALGVEWEPQVRARSLELAAEGRRRRSEAVAEGVAADLFGQLALAW